MEKKINPATSVPLTENQSELQEKPPQAQPEQSRRGLKLRTNIKAGLKPSTGADGDQQ